jgi:hypothetical protein
MTIIYLSKFITRINNYRLITNNLVAARNLGKPLPYLRNVHNIKNLLALIKVQVKIRVPILIRV